MTNFQKELITAIEEVSTSTGLTVNECIRQAIELTKTEKEEYENNTENLEEKVDRYYKKMFKRWRN
jgi:Na+-translocating ferredoxin:NAD+ oxidoreductase RNF subunit RnfB|nr:MAG TPA: SeqA protein N-terminal domain [Caudoviricetes sp.]